jgi:carboxylesterase type B
MLGRPAPLSAQQLNLSNRIMNYWTTFAGSGRPGSRASSWSAYQDDQDRVLSFATNDIGYEWDFAKYHHSLSGMRSF